MRTRASSVSMGRRHLLRLVLSAGAASAAHGACAAAEPASKALVVAFVSDFEPFVMGEDRGILVELVREGARRLGYSVRKMDFPSLRFDQDPLDDFASLDMFVGTPATRRANYHYAPLYAFDNVAASLTERGLQIASVQDLAGKSIVAFNNAAMHLKEPFSSFHHQFLAHARSYLETERMESLVAMMLTGRAQVVLIDRTFLRYYARKQGHPDLQGITLHELFPELNIVYAVSKNQVLIAQLQQQLQHMEKSGWTAAMLKNYL